MLAAPRRAGSPSKWPSRGDALSASTHHYSGLEHALELVRAGDFRQDVFHPAISEEMIQQASFVAVLTGIFGRAQWKYVDRSYRDLMLGAGRL